MSHSQAPWQWKGDDLILNIHLQPRASRDEIVAIQADGHLKVRITSPPVDGKANDHLIRFLARQCGVGRSAVTLLSGQTGRYKRLRIHQPKRLPELLASK